MSQSSDLRRWLAYGTGIGVEIRPGALAVTIARVRPSGASVTASATIAGFGTRPAAEWGAEYMAFVRKHGAGHLAATVLLPRGEVIVRSLNLAGVPGRELASAVALQIDSLHPYGEDEAAWAWSRVSSRDAVLVAILRRSRLEHYLELFGEAGIRLAQVTFSAAVLHPALRLVGAPPAGGFLAMATMEEGWEAYGESEARPVFSAVFEGNAERACALAASELRLESDAQPLELGSVLPRPRRAPDGYDPVAEPLPYAAALAGACPLLSRPLNLLPAELRASTSRVRYVPTAALALLLAAAAIALAAVNPVEDRKYMSALAREIARVEPEARKAAALDRDIDSARARAHQLDAFRRRTVRDMDVLAEMTKILPPASFLQSMELSRKEVTIGGAAEQAAPLVKTVDASPLFSGSEFTIPISRSGPYELYRLRADREGIE